MLDSRMSAMADFVRAGSRVADIGADHGYLSIELAKSGRASKVIATDKNAGPIAAAKKNIADTGLEKIIDVRQGDGLKVLHAGEVDTICIAGMGGALIVEILSASPEVFNSAENLILQPMNALDKVKNFLTQNNWFIADIDLAEVGGIVYEIISAVKNPAEISATPLSMEKNPLRIKYYELRIKKFERVLIEMSKSPAAMSTEKFLQFQREVEELKNKITR